MYLIRKMCGSGGCSKMSGCCFGSIFAFSAVRWEILVSRFPVLIDFSISFSNFMYLIRRCLVAVLSSILFWRPSCKFSNLEVQFPLPFLSFFASLKCDLLWRSWKFVRLLWFLAHDRTSLEIDRLELIVVFKVDEFVRPMCTSSWYNFRFLFFFGFCFGVSIEIMAKFPLFSFVFGVHIMRTSATESRLHTEAAAQFWCHYWKQWMRSRRRLMFTRNRIDCVNDPWK